MNFGDLQLRGEERAVFTLRALFQKYGYTHFKMRKFEEYDLYVRNKDFLLSDSVITFTDTNGKLLALKPDVTLSIIKNTEDKPGVQKLYYNENVYRVSPRSKAFEELMQLGLECIGEIDEACVLEVLSLAAESLMSLSENAVLTVSHMGVVSAVLDACTDDYEIRKKLLHCLSEKNLHEMKEICSSAGVSEENARKLRTLLDLSGQASETLADIPEVNELNGVISELEALGYGNIIKIDYSAVSDLNYYNGIVFKGFINGIPESVLSGGRYDKLMHKMGRSSSAIGFAVYLDTLERLGAEQEIKDDGLLNIALPKGRLGEKVYSMLERAGFECPQVLNPGRKLIFENRERGVRYFWVKPSDVAIYVERGAADIGVAGKDILLEYQPDVYELLDLNTGKCRMAVAAPKCFNDDADRTLRVATKFKNIAESYYSSLGRDIDIIHLNGSIEIAPILGLSDVIVDIVETGSTLRENDLEVKADIVPISARLISNKASYNFKRGLIDKLTESVAAQTEAKND